MITPERSTTYSDTEERIFASAMEVFAHKGRAGARMQEIADKAGINKALVHYYFRSKDRLYSEVFHFIFRRNFALMSEALRTEGPIENVLRAFMLRYMTTLEENPLLPRFIMREVLDGGDTFHANFLDVFEGGATAPPVMFAKRIRAAIRAGEIVDVDPAQLFITIIGSCMFYFVSQPIMGRIDPKHLGQTRRNTRRRMEHVLDVLYLGLKPRKERGE